MRFFWILLFITVPTFANAEVVDRIVARVNNSMITQSDVNEALNNLDSLLSYIPDPAERERKRVIFRNDIVNTLVNEKILQDDIEKQNITISEAQVDQAMQSIAARHQTTLEGMRARMAEQGMSFEKYRESLKRDLRKEEFFRKVIYPRIKLTDYDLEDYYKKHSRDFIGYSEVHFLEILINSQSPLEGASPQAFADGLVTKLRKGGDFKAAAKKYSQGPYAPNSGDSGWVKTSEMRSDLVNFLLNLRGGEISDPINTPTGILIFKLLDKRNPQPRPFNEVKEFVRQACGQSQVAEQVENYVRELRSRSFVEIKS